MSNKFVVVAFPRAKLSEEINAKGKEVTDLQRQMMRACADANGHIYGKFARAPNAADDKHASYLLDRYVYFDAKLAEELVKVIYAYANELVAHKAYLMKSTLVILII